LGSRVIVGPTVLVFGLPLPMSNILARCMALGIVAGGFALTGDLSRLASRGFEVLNASDIPAADATAEPDGHAGATSLLPSAPLLPAGGPEAAPKAITSDAAAAAAPALPVAEPSADAAPVAHDLDFKPPVGGVAQVDLTSLTAGDRLIIWLKLPRRTGSLAYRCLVFDMVDPQAGEALVYEAVSFTATGQPQATATPPQRVRIGADGQAGDAVAPGGRIRIQRLGIAHAGTTEAGDVIGPIQSLDIIR
jgi:hypothetical protein